MIRNVLGFLVVAGAVALVACSSDETSKYPSTDSFCTVLANAKCTDPNAGGVSVEASCPVADTACQTARKAACETNVTASVNAGRVYNANNVDTCLAATKTATAAPSVKANLDAQADACARVFAGTKSTSQACTSTYDCKAGLVCDETSNTCETAVTKGADAPCADPGDVCATGYFCDHSTPTPRCQLGHKAGEACSATSPCDPTVAYCSTTICVALGDTAASCHANEECKTNFCNAKNLCAARTYASAKGLCSDYGGSD